MNPQQPYVPPTTPPPAGQPNPMAQQPMYQPPAYPPAPAPPIAPAYNPAPAGSPMAAPAFPAPQPPQQPTPLANVKQEVTQRLQQANNVLVTVSNNPSVDQLASAIALTLLLNKLDKHATAVFSGEVPNTIEFLQPEKTIEKTTDSLRDFIIALDKSKADKLRYKVEDKYVKIFITPYHTSLNEDDLEFSQGDFNVDVVIALGVHHKEELDNAITAHGRILHDAVVISVNNKQTADLGSINWYEPTASSLSEMLVSVVEPLQGKKILLDGQIATSFLTGIVAETDRFSNDKTTPHTMNVSATLMKAGANQQLIASKLEEPEPIPELEKTSEEPAQAKSTQSGANVPLPTPVTSADGSLAIEHPLESGNTKTLADLEEALAQDNANAENQEDDLDKIHIDDNGRLQRLAELREQQERAAREAATNQFPEHSSNMILEPPTLGGELSANTKTTVASPSYDPLSQPVPTEVGSMQHSKPLQPLNQPAAAPETPQTLDQIEQAVNSPHLSEQDARAQVSSIENQIAQQKPEPIAALNAQPLGDIRSDSADAVSSKLVPPDNGPPPDPTAASHSPTAPPPVPPPLMPPAGK